MKNIKKEDYTKALKIVQEYNEELTNSLIKKEYTCAICEKNKIYISEDIFIDLFKQEQSMWNGGGLNRVTFGYGSKHDRDTYYIGTCDDCIDNLKEKKLITNIKELKKKYRELYEE